jgi:F0F1-type ATP synthase membrane subunit c/vacuolar-type H+-ATPase subunit K
MKKVLKKLLVIILIFLTINSAVFPNVSQAYPGEDIVNAIGDWIIGLFTYPIQLFLNFTGRAINLITAGVAGVDDDTISTSITPFDILFSGAKNNNKDVVKIVRVNFFDDTIKDDSIIGRIRNGISTWYYILRMIACVILLVILVYVGIRMALTTIASDKAMYTKMLTDWACSLALIFLLQYIMIFTFTVNDALVTAMATISKDTDMSSAIDTIFWRGFNWGVDGIGSAAVYFILVTQTIGLLISYINRMLKIAFLMIISPLITLTYSIDKMGDGKAQALGTWLKEFVFTVLMQPFHCIIYMVMVSTSIELLNDNVKELGYAVLAIVCIRFVKQAEEIVRRIFHFEDDNKGTSIAGGMMMASAALAHSKNIGKTLKSGVTGAKNLATGAKDFLGHAKTDALVMGAILSRNNTKTDANGNKQKMSYAELKEDIQTKQDEKKAQKYSADTRKALIEEAKKIKKENPGMTAKAAMEKARANLDDRATQIQNSNPGMSRSRAIARAKFEMGKDKRKRDRQEKQPKIIKSARGTMQNISSTYNAFKQTDVFKDLQDAKNTYLALGTGAAMGIAMYGNGQDAMQSGMAGMAAYSSIREATKNTNKTLVNDAVQSIASIDGNTAAEKEQKLISLAQNDGKEFETNSDKIKDLLSNLEKELQNLGMDSVSANTFKNKVHSEVSLNAVNGNNVPISDIVRNNIAKYNSTSAGREKPISMAKDFSTINKAALNLNKFENEKIAYQSVHKLMDTGLTQSAAVADIMKQYNSYEKSNMSISGTEFIQDKEKIEEMTDNQAKTKMNNHNAEVDVIDSDVEKQTELEVDRIVKEFESKTDMNKLTEHYAKDIMDDAKATISTELQKEISRIAEAATKDEKIMKNEFEKIKIELDKTLTEALNQKAKLEQEKDKLLKNGSSHQIVEAEKALAENIYKIQYVNSAKDYMNTKKKSK